MNVTWRTSTANDHYGKRMGLAKQMDIGLAIITSPANRHPTVMAIKSQDFSSGSKISCGCSEEDIVLMKTSVCILKLCHNLKYPGN